VAGWERHRLPGICRDFGTGMLGLHPASPAAERLDSLIPEDSRFKDKGERTGRGLRVVRDLQLLLGHEDFLEYQGHVIESFPLLLNTVLALGSDPFKLAARFAGQMYSHAWIPGRDRKWAADLIEEGMTEDIFRHKIRVTDPSPVIPNASVQTDHHTGWTDVIELLRETDRGPVVLSVSTGDDFPNGYVLGVPADEEDDMEVDQMWDIAELWLANRHQGHKISSRHHRTYRFDHRLTAFDLIATDWEDRLARAIAEKRI